MQELAAIAVWTEAGLMKLQARFGFEVRRHMSLLDQFVVAVCERTRVTEFACPRDLPISAHLGLELRLILLHKLFTVALTSKFLLGPLDSCHLLFILTFCYHLDRSGSDAWVEFVELGSMNLTNAIIIFINLIPIDSGVGHLFHRAGSIKIFEFIFLIRWTAAAAATGIWWCGSSKACIVWVVLLIKSIESTDILRYFLLCRSEINGIYL